jgi:RNA polymerase sigma factor (sigma-70 family)
MVRGFCSGLLRDRAEADDAAQQTFLAAHRALLRGGDPREPAAWLAAIARNECLARVRERMREPLPTMELRTAVSTSDPVTIAIARGDLRAMWQAVSELSPQQQRAFLLREFSGLSYEGSLSPSVSRPARSNPFSFEGARVFAHGSRLSWHRSARRLGSRPCAISFRAGSTPGAPRKSQLRPPQPSSPGAPSSASASSSTRGTQLRSRRALSARHVRSNAPL